MIRKMQKSDADRVYEIENQAFFEPWSKQSLIKDLKDNTFLNHYVLEEEGEILGFYIVSYILDEAEIFTIAIDNTYRRRGLGSKLLDHLIEKSKQRDVSKIWLEVSTKNTPALRLYEKYGFVKVGLRKNYYQKVGEDAYNMLKEL